MKRIIFLMGVIPFFLNSCVVNKKNLKEAYNTNPSAEENYFGSNNALSEKAALAMISIFPEHKLRGWHKKKLDNAWGAFDMNDLRNIFIVKKDNVDSVKFFLASTIVPTKDSFRLPTLLLQVKLKETNFTNAKGSAQQFAKYQYISAQGLCPPPPGGCRIQPQ